MEFFFLEILEVLEILSITKNFPMNRPKYVSSRSFVKEQRFDLHSPGIRIDKYAPKTYRRGAISVTMDNVASKDGVTMAAASDRADGLAVAVAVLAAHAVRLADLNIFVFQFFYISQSR